MAAVIKINDFKEQLGKGVHHFGTDTFKLVFTNAAPVAANAVLADLTRVALTNTSGGDVDPTVTITASETDGTMTVGGDSVTLTATGAVGPFQYYTLYNDSATSPADALVQAWNHGSAVTLASGETFKISFNNDDTAGTILTIGDAA